MFSALKFHRKLSEGRLLRTDIHTLVSVGALKRSLLSGYMKRFMESTPTPQQRVMVEWQFKRVGVRPPEVAGSPWVRASEEAVVRLGESF